MGDTICNMWDTKNTCGPNSQFKKASPGPIQPLSQSEVKISVVLNLVFISAFCLKRKIVLSFYASQSILRIFLLEA